MEDNNLDPSWRKASYSGNGGGNCVEAGSLPGSVLVRDTANRDGAVIEFSAGAWRALVVNIKHGE
jgi:hypothetical protein